MPSPIFNEFVQGVLDSRMVITNADGEITNADGKLTIITVRERLRTLLIEKTNLDKVGHDKRAVERELKAVRVAITAHVASLHEVRRPKYDDRELFNNRIMYKRPGDGSNHNRADLSLDFIQALYLEATQNGVKKHSSAVVGTAIGLPVVAFAATAITMLAYNFAVTGMVFGGGSLATALGALSFLPLAFVPGGLVGVLVFAALIAATALVVYGVGVGITALLTTNGVDAVKMARDDVLSFRFIEASDVVYASKTAAKAARAEAPNAAVVETTLDDVPQPRRRTSQREGAPHSAASSDNDQSVAPLAAAVGSSRSLPAENGSAPVLTQPTPRLHEAASVVVEMRRPRHTDVAQVAHQALDADRSTCVATAALFADTDRGAEVVELTPPPAVPHTVSPLARSPVAGSPPRGASPHAPAAAADGDAPVATPTGR